MSDDTVDPGRTWRRAVHFRRRFVKQPARETCTSNSLQKKQDDRSRIDGWRIH